MQKLLDRVAIVTGSGRGIGRATALKLASEGASVVVNDLDAEVAEQVTAEITAAGGKALACAGSVTESGFADRLVGTATDGFGALDIVVNNAGYTWDSVIQKMTDEQWEAILAVNLSAPFKILRAAQPYFKAHPVEHHRKVVNVSSTSGYYGNAGQSNYGAAKAGLIGLTKTLSKEWGRYKVNVNAVAFGFIMTRMTQATDGPNSTLTIDGRDIKVGISPERLASMEKVVPLTRGGYPEEAAGGIYLLCLPESDYVNGQCLVIDGGRV